MGPIKNRDRLLNAELAQRFFAEVNWRAKKFMSDDHFTVDGTLIQAWASQKSFRAKDGSDGGDGTNFHGQKRSNQTHEWTTDPDTRLYKKSYGKEAHLAYLGHPLVENRNGLIAQAMATTADSFPEREAALTMLEERHQGRKRRITGGCRQGLRSQGLRRRRAQAQRHAACHEGRQEARLEPRPENHSARGYAISLSRRWLVEKCFAFARLKQTGPIRQVKLRGLHEVDWLFVFSCAPLKARGELRLHPARSIQEASRRPINTGQNYTSNRIHPTSSTNHKNGAPLRASSTSS